MVLTGEIEVSARSALGWMPDEEKGFVPFAFERIAPGALKGTEMGHCSLLYGHNEMAIPVASYRSGSLTIKEADDKWTWRAELNNTTGARDMYEAVKAGDLREVSFGFRVAEKDLSMTTKMTDGEESTEIVVRKITELHEISVVNHAVYPSDVNARSKARSKEMAINLRNKFANQKNAYICLDGSRAVQIENHMSNQPENTNPAPLQNNSTNPAPSTGGGVDYNQLAAAIAEQMRSMQSQQPQLPNLQTTSKRTLSQMLKQRMLNMDEGSSLKDEFAALVDKYIEEEGGDDDPPSDENEETSHRKFNMGKGKGNAPINFERVAGGSSLAGAQVQPFRRSKEYYEFAGESAISTRLAEEPALVELALARAMYGEEKVNFKNDNLRSLANEAAYLLRVSNQQRQGKFTFPISVFQNTRAPLTFGSNSSSLPTMTFPEGELIAEPLLSRLPVERVTTSGNTTIPIVSAKGSAGFVAENAALAENQSLTTVGMKPKRAGVVLEFSHEFAAGDGSMEGMGQLMKIFRAQVAAELTYTLDTALLTQDDGTHKGILNRTVVAGNDITVGSSRTSTTYAQIAAFIGNAMDRTHGGERTTAIVVNGRLANQITALLVAGGSAGVVYNDMPGSAFSICGIPVYVSSRIPTANSNGADRTTLIYGDFAKMRFQVYGGGLTFITDPYTDSRTGKISITGTFMGDIAVKQPKAFGLWKAVPVTTLS